MKLTPEQFKEISARFDDEFVCIDTGPDGDGYDAKLPSWNDFFKNVGEKDYDQEFSQIELIKNFIKSELEKNSHQKSEDMESVRKAAYSQGTIDILQVIRNQPKTYFK